MIRDTEKNKIELVRCSKREFGRKNTKKRPHFHPPRLKNVNSTDFLSLFCHFLLQPWRGGVVNMMSQPPAAPISIRSFLGLPLVDRG